MVTPASTAVSVIVPAFNVGSYVERCVASILRQSLRQLEVVVVNDASTDDTAAVLDRLAAGDDRLKVIHLRENAGVHAARAQGVRAATGDYIGFADADDWLAPNMCETLHGEAVRTGADIVLCGATTALSPEQPGNAKVRFRRRRVLTDHLLERFCRLEFGSGVLWNKLYAAELIRTCLELPLIQKVVSGEDYIVNVGCFARAEKVVTLPASLYYYYERPESQSRAGANAKSFCEAMRAYTVCLAAYANTLTPRELSYVEDLYARQFGFPRYWVGDPAELAPYRGELQSILRQLADVHPAGIYPLVHTFRRTNGLAMLKLALRTLLAQARRYAGLAHGATH